MKPPATRTRVIDVQALPMPEGRRSRLAFQTADIEWRLYEPPNPDPQTPHRRDEVYVVIRGEGHFVRNQERVPFGPGDVLFAAAGEAHRFENVSGDTQVWVVFYGPEQAA